jgi:proline racemase
MEQTEYPPMSGGNTISVVTVLLETGILPMKEPRTELTLESPAGLSGQAWITGFNTYVLDPSDPFPEGFRICDIWPM